MALTTDRGPAATAEVEFFRQDPSVESAWRRSFLGPLSIDRAVLADLFSDATYATFASGHIARLGRSGWSEQSAVSLVVKGVFRAYLSHPNGRQTTVQYMRAGDVWGIVRLLTPSNDSPHRMNFQALEMAQVVSLNGEKFARFAMSRPDVSWALAQEVAKVVGVRTQALSSSTFATVSERVTQHLCALAVVVDNGPPIVDVSHQELADAVGTVREVVTRVIAQLKSDGLLRYSGRHLEILNMRALKAMGPLELDG
jgi:CRP/FNR family cyclic AMP-dependent transcriptional regulator